MILIRSTLFFIGMLITTIVIAGFISITGWFMPYRMRCQLSNVWGGTNLWLLRVLCNLKYEIKGQENLPQGGTVILSKHQSAWETMALRHILPPEQAWVLKRELLWVPFFGWALALVEPIAINRKAGTKSVKQVIRQGLEQLEKGRNVILFPEGTRVAPGTRKKYSVGGALLAHKAGVPVVPIAHNAGSFWRRRGIKKYPGTIQLIVGEPITTENKSTAEINAAVETWIEAQMEKLEQHIPNSKAE